MAFLTGYTKRKLSPTVNDGVLNTDYQTLFNPKKTTGSDSGSVVYLGSSVQDDFDDIRVTKIDNTELYQWQESVTSGTEAKYWAKRHKTGSSLLSGNASSGQKVVNVNAGSVFAANDWVLLKDDSSSELCQIDSISTNELMMKSNLVNAYTTAANAKVCHAVYVYYNNSGASLSSNGANTFPVFDKFDDASQWSGDTARASVAGNILTFTALAGTTWYYLYNNTTLSNNVRGRMSANLTNADYNVVGIGSAAKEYWNEVGTGHDSTKTNHSSWATSDGDSFTAMSNTAIGFDADHIFEFHRLLTGTDTARAFYDNASVGADVTTDVGTAAYTIRIRAYAGSHLHLNWVWLAQSTYNDATLIGTWGAEETQYAQAVGSGSVTPSSTIVKSTSKSMGNGAVSIAAAVIKMTSKLASIGAGSVGIAGDVITSKAIVYYQAVGDGVVAISGALTKSISKLAGEGSVAISGIVTKMTSKIAGSGSITPTGNASKSTSKIAGSGSIIPASTLTKSISKSVGNGAVSIAAALTSYLVKFMFIIVKHRKYRAITVDHRKYRQIHIEHRG